MEESSAGESTGIPVAPPARRNYHKVLLILLAKKEPDPSVHDYRNTRSAPALMSVHSYLVGRRSEALGNGRLAGLKRYQRSAGQRSATVAFNYGRRPARVPISWHAPRAASRALRCLQGAIINRPEGRVCPPHRARAEMAQLPVAKPASACLRF